MILLSTRELEKIATNVSLDPRHPFNLLLLETSLEDAALGGYAGISALQTGPSRGKISRSQLERARKNAQKIGRRGEEIISDYLKFRQSQGLIISFVWEADDNAIAPYDFQVTELDGTEVFIDVKSTSGNFNSAIHISYNELLQMSQRQRYDLYRVFNLDGDIPKLRIAEQVNGFARNIVRVLDKLPERVNPAGVSLPPSELNFGDVIEIEIPEEK